MSPRRYRMGARGQREAATRQSIVEAAVALHSEQGIMGTSWDELAERAGVAVSTVYRHFPNLEALIPACTRAEFEAGARLPTPDEVTELFVPDSGVAARLEKLIEGSCRCYERGDAWLDVCRREAHLVPALAEATAIQQRALGLLVRGALGTTTRTRRAEAALISLLDYPFWKALRSAGVASGDVSALLAALAKPLIDQVKED